MVGRCCFFTPSSAISARMPPSPSLSTRMAKETYLTVVMMKSVQTTSESAPRTVGGVGMGSRGTENGLEGIKRAGADIAEHNAQRRQTQNGQLALRSLLRHFGDIRRSIFAQCAVQCEKLTV